MAKRSSFQAKLSVHKRASCWDFNDTVNECDKWWAQSINTVLLKHCIGHLSTVFMVLVCNVKESRVLFFGNLNWKISDVSLCWKWRGLWARRNAHMFVATNSYEVRHEVIAPSEAEALNIDCALKWAGGLNWEACARYILPVSKLDFWVTPGLWNWRCLVYSILSYYAWWNVRGEDLAC